MQRSLLALFFVMAGCATASVDDTPAAMPFMIRAGTPSYYTLLSCDVIIKNECVYQFTTTIDLTTTIDPARDPILNLSGRWQGDVEVTGFTDGRGAPVTIHFSHHCRTTPTGTTCASGETNLCVQHTGAACIEKLLATSFEYAESEPLAARYSLRNGAFAVTVSGTDAITHAPVAIPAVLIVN